MKSPRSKKIFWFLFLPIWQAILIALRLILAFTRFFKDRKLSQAHLESLKEKRAVYLKCAVFFCSSAGEYEQAIPIIEKMQKENNQTFVHVFFFSASGLTFAQKRNPSISYSLAPIDFTSEWNLLFKILRPSCFFVVRHEFWPSFLYVAKSFGPIYLINAGKRGSKDAHSYLKAFVKKKCFGFFDKIFTVSEEDRDFFLNFYELDSHSVITSGDTKYDRAISYAQNILNKGSESAAFIKNLFKGRSIFMVGSAWDQDILLALDAYSRLSSAEKKTTALLVVPHQVNEKRNLFIQSACAKYQLTYGIYSHQKNHHENQVDVFVFDTIGHLTQLYSICLWAWVGGGIDHQVHNVLEPASFALSVRFGKKFNNSAEAVDLVQSSLTPPLEKPEELVAWLKDPLGAKENGCQIYEHIKPHSGASMKIFREWASL